jgi:hypothetical protein
MAKGVFIARYGNRKVQGLGLMLADLACKGRLSVEDRCPQRTGSRLLNFRCLPEGVSFGASIAHCSLLIKNRKNCRIECFQNCMVKAQTRANDYGSMRTTRC